jgi:phosphohistidine phosphatase
LKQIVLVRHATAVETGPRGSDFHRRLKKRGRREALLMAERLATFIARPDLLLSSPADRALETAVAFGNRFGISAGEIVQREQLYGGLLPDEFLRIVQALDDRRKTVLVFGHDPSFSEFAALLAEPFNDLIPKAGFVVIDLPRRSWRAIRSGDGSVAAFERPPAPDVQKRMEAEIADRLAGTIRGVVFGALRKFDIPENPDVVKAVARAAARVTKSVLPMAIASAGTSESPVNRPARARGRALQARKRKAEGS